MDRKKIITAAGTTAAVFAILAAGGTSPSDAVSVTWGAARHAALLTAGIKLPDNTTAFPARNPIFSEEEQPLTEESPPECTEAAELQLTLEEAELTAEQTEQTPESPQPTAVTSEAPSEPYARVITQNIAEFDDGVDRTSAGNRSGPIYRKHYGDYVGDDYIDLPGGGVVWNCTSDSAEKLTAAAESQPDIVVTPDVQEPQVLIVHTHTTESYEPYQRSYYDAEYPFRTRDPDYNMTRVGDALAQKLAEHGISVLHDRALYDDPEYNGAYYRAEDAIEAYMEKYPSIGFILDVHRDALEDKAGHQYKVVTREDPDCAQVSLVMGSSWEGWQENLKFAVAVQQHLTERYPTLMRPLTLRNSDYNEYFTPGSLLVEIGAAGNSLDEALKAVRVFGEGFAEVVTGK